MLCTASTAFADDFEYVTDAAGLLTEYERSELNAMAKEISERQQCGVFIVTVRDYRTIYNGDIDSCAEGFFDHYNLGMGSDRDGTLLLISTSTREFCHSAHGYGNVAFTDYGKDVMADSYLRYLGNDDWYNAFRDFLTSCDKLLTVAHEGTPFDVTPDYGPSSRSPIQVLLMLVIFPGLIALMVCAGLKKKMVSVRKQTGAQDYIANGGINLSVKQDVFTHRTQTRRIIETQSRSSGGGGFHGGTTVNSHGFSSHSGKF